MSLCVIKLSAIALLLCVANSAPVDKRQTSSDFASVDTQQADSPSQNVQNSAALTASSDGENGDSAVFPPGADGQFNAGSLTSQTDGQVSLGAVDPASGSEQINSGVVAGEQGQGVDGQYDLGATSPEQGTSQFSGLEDPTQGGFNPVSKRQVPEAAAGNEQTQVSLDAQSPAGEGQEPLSALTGQEGTGSDSSQFVDQVQQDQGTVEGDSTASSPELQVPSDPQYLAQSGQEGIESGSSPSLGQVQQDQATGTITTE